MYANAREMLRTLSASFAVETPRHTALAVSTADGREWARMFPKPLILGGRPHDPALGSVFPPPMNLWGNPPATDVGIVTNLPRFEKSAECARSAVPKRRHTAVAVSTQMDCTSSRLRASRLGGRAKAVCGHLTAWFPQRSSTKGPEFFASFAIFCSKAAAYFSCGLDRGWARMGRNWPKETKECEKNGGSFSFASFRSFRPSPRLGPRDAVSLAALREGSAWAMFHRPTACTSCSNGVAISAGPASAWAWSFGSLPRSRPGRRRVGQRGRGRVNSSRSSSRVCGRT
jgi:hypothetical protein